MTPISQRRRTGRVAVGVLAAAALVFGLSPNANAEPVDFSYQLVGGNVSTDPDGDGLDIPADGTFGLVGTWDDETGALDVDLVAPPFEFFPEDAPIDVVFIDIEDAPMTGSIDPDTGEVELSGATSMSLDLGGLGLIICTIDPVNLALSSDAPGGFPLDFDDATFAIGQDDLSVPAAECDNPAVADQLNDFLGLPTDEAAILLEFAEGELVPPTPLEPPAGPGNGTDPDEDLDTDDEIEEIVEIIEITEPVGAGPRFTG